MKTIEIIGNKPLSGVIKIGGAKNSVVALIPAAILCDEEVIIENVPNISDVDNLCEILNLFDINYSYQNEILKMDLKKMHNEEINREFATKLRASYYFMGALLSKYKKAIVSVPGGCKIGKRPINYHIKAFRQMGVDIKVENDKYILTAPKLHGADIYLDFASVGATINIILAATKATGTTIIHNAAKEPEIVNVVTFLNNMGAKISGAGTSKIKIDGVKYLKKACIEVIPDRIEAMTYIIIGALIGKNLKIENIIPTHLETCLAKIKDMKISFLQEKNYIILNHQENFESVNLKTLVYPGFPTDILQPFSVLLTQSIGRSHIEETIYENRMGHIPYLKKMGAKITYDSKTATIFGPTKLQGTEVFATDLRAGAALVCAGLIATGKTTIFDAEHILRGYENISEKLNKVGANVIVKEI